ncbi:hypothetical protein Tco_0493909 [Tanacetum coccineum]
MTRRARLSSSKKKDHYWDDVCDQQESDDEEELTTSSGMNLQLGNESLIYVDNHHFSPSDYEATNLLRSPISLKTSKHRPIKSGSSSSSSSNPTPENNTLGLADYFLQSEDKENAYTRDAIELYYEAGSGGCLSKKEIISNFLQGTVASHIESFGDDETYAAKSSANGIASVVYARPLMLKDVEELADGVKITKGAKLDTWKPKENLVIRQRTTMGSITPEFKPSIATHSPNHVMYPVVTHPISKPDEVIVIDSDASFK